jgi:uncharacterized protein (TIGR03435 family)
VRRDISLTIAAALLGGGMATGQPPPKNTPAFEVASIKPSPPERPHFPYQLGPITFSMEGRLDHLIEQAYEVKHYQVTGGPAWAYSDFYQVQARASTAASAHEMRVMLQTLLAERFQLKLHRETRAMAGYAITVDKKGAKLPPARTDVPADSLGVVQIGDGIWARGAPVKQLAYGLTLDLEQPVVDDTNIAGNYDLRLRYDEGDVTDKVSAAMSALHEFGLKLEPRKLPIQVLVIDSAERPSAN